MKNLYFAPVQGHTDAAFRHFHSKIYGGNQTYYTPFIRLEKNGLRPRDIKDFTSPLNQNHHIVPQIIFRDKNELNTLISLLKDLGAKEIDLNMGCPFPLQTGHGRGAATVANPELGLEVARAVENNPSISFSVKMRLGMKEPDEWKILLPHLNNVNLKHIVVHPRVAKQQYTGNVDMVKFEKILEESKNPVVYNGDIISSADYDAIIEKYPDIDGIMMARGILGRPSLISEITEGKDWDKGTRLNKMLEFHRQLFSYYSGELCGDAQIISKIKPFWEYAENEIGRKAWKAIKKSTNLAKYQTAVAMIQAI